MKASQVHISRRENIYRASSCQMGSIDKRFCSETIYSILVKSLGHVYSVLVGRCG
jgi:hypothetical protein